MPHSTHAPARTCIGCRAVCPASALVRLALTERGIEVTSRSVGRGAWLHPSADCARAAIKMRAFARAFRKSVSFPATDDLIAAVLSAAQPRP
jgi:predicted RNA-binding protein YlxR (DUF448 family)